MPVARRGGGGGGRGRARGGGGKEEGEGGGLLMVLFFSPTPELPVLLSVSETGTFDAISMSKGGVGDGIRDTMKTMLALAV